MAYSMSDYRRERAELELELVTVESRRGRYSNIPTELERSIEKNREELRKASTQHWKTNTFPRISGRAAQ